jgi:EAL domain-containing protein (putative c-di-GMP-specific phosphodiesterase class I)
MNLSVIAEGVETEEQAAFLLRHGCHRAQGYLYGRPVGPEALLQEWGQNKDERHEGRGTGTCGGTCGGT